MKHADPQRLPGHYCAARCLLCSYATQLAAQGQFVREHEVLKVGPGKDVKITEVQKGDLARLSRAFSREQRQQQKT